MRHKIIPVLKNLSISIPDLNLTAVSQDMMISNLVWYKGDASSTMYWRSTLTPKAATHKPPTLTGQNAFVDGRDSIITPPNPYQYKVIETWGRGNKVTN